MRWFGCPQDMTRMLQDITKIPQKYLQEIITLPKNLNNPRIFQEFSMNISREYSVIPCFGCPQDITIIPYDINRIPQKYPQKIPMLPDDLVTPGKLQQSPRNISQVSNVIQRFKCLQDITRIICDITRIPKKYPKEIPMLTDDLVIPGILQEFPRNISRGSNVLQRFGCPQDNTRIPQKYSLRTTMFFDGSDFPIILLAFPRNIP